VSQTGNAITLLVIVDELEAVVRVGSGDGVGVGVVAYFCLKLNDTFS